MTKTRAAQLWAIVFTIFIERLYPPVIYILLIFQMVYMVFHINEFEIPLSWSLLLDSYKPIMFGGRFFSTTIHGFWRTFDMFFYTISSNHKQIFIFMRICSKLLDYTSIPYLPGNKLWCSSIHLVCVQYLIHSLLPPHVTTIFYGCT